MSDDLKTKRILVIEDEYFIAFDLARALVAAGAEVVGPAGDLATGLRLADSEEIDAAILDVDLDGAMSYPIADRLAQAQVPHLFLTGYDGWSLPAIYRNIPCLPKPFAMSGLLALVGRLCGQQAQA